MTVLKQHLSGRNVLDLTFGTGLSWPVLDDLFGYDFDLTKSDAKPPYSQDLFTAATDKPEWLGKFDVVYYDPPWYVDIEADSDDAREDVYGGYGAQTRTLEHYIAFVNSIPKFLRPGGKLIVKCGDQYHVKQRRLLLHHLSWCEAMEHSFDLVDFFIYRYHRTSPTAYQVKDRPCSVINHSYFIVGQDRRPPEPK